MMSSDHSVSLTLADIAEKEGKSNKITCRFKERGPKKTGCKVVSFISSIKIGN